MSNLLLIRPYLCSADNNIGMNTILKSAKLVLILVLIAGAITYFWIDNDSIQSVTNPDISSAINLLQIYIVVFTIGIGIAGFYGYKTLKDFAKDYLDKHFEAKNQETDKRLRKALARNIETTTTAVQDTRELEQIKDQIKTLEARGITG